MKVYLDDVRPVPDESWILVKTATETIALLETGQVTELSLDHDLEPGHYTSLDENNDPDWTECSLDSRTGYAVVVWLENKVRSDTEFVMPEVKVHSMNPVGRAHMERGLAAIREYLKSRARI